MKAANKRTSRCISKQTSLFGGFKTDTDTTMLALPAPGNVVNHITTKAGIMAFTFHTLQAPIKPVNMQAFWKNIHQSKALQQEIKFIGVFPIRARRLDNHIKQNELQLLCSVGTNATICHIKKLAVLVAHHANRATNTKGSILKRLAPTYLGEDLTPLDGPVPLDSILVDSDVISVMKLAHPGHTLREIGKDDKTLENYFEDANRADNVFQTELLAHPHDFKNMDSDSGDTWITHSNEELPTVAERQKHFDDSCFDDSSDDSDMDD